MDGKELKIKYTEFCDTQHCDSCKYNSQYCEFQFAYDLACKKSFDACLGLLECFKEGSNEQTK